MLTLKGNMRNGRVTNDPTGGSFTVEFPHGKVYYATLSKVIIGRMYADALKNVPKANKRSRNGWVDLAYATGILQPYLTRAGLQRSRSSMSSGVANKIFSMATRGTLPRDPEQLQKLLTIAGQEWLDAFTV